MKLEDIQTIWAKDAQIDGEKLDSESIKIPQLHNKYYIIYSDERLRLKSFQFEMDKITKLKREYFGGRMDKEELDKLGWVPFPFKLLKNDIVRLVYVFILCLTGDNNIQVAIIIAVIFCKKIRLKNVHVHSIPLNKI